MSATILCEPNDLEEPFVDTLELTYIKTGSIKGTGQMFHLNGMMNCWHPFCRWVCDLDARVKIRRQNQKENAPFVQIRLTLRYIIYRNKIVFYNDVGHLGS